MTTAIVFYEVFPLAFDMAGLPSGTNFSVTLSATSTVVILTSPLAGSSLTRWSDGAGSVTFHVSNGTYSYVAGAAGYTSVSGTVAVAGASPATIPLSFVATSSSSSGLPLLDYVLIAVVVVVIVVVIAVVMMRGRKGKTPPPVSDSPPPTP